MTALVGLSLPRLPISDTASSTGKATVSRLGALLPLPRDPLSLALLTVFTALLVLSLTLRRALPAAPHSKALPASGSVWLWCRDALARLVDILEDDEEEAELVKRAHALRSGGSNNNDGGHSSNEKQSQQRTFTLDGTEYRLPAAPPKGLHRPKQRGVPLASPPAPMLSFVPPTPPVRVEMPRRPLSAAKLIMSRHSVRKPYRPPPVPGAPRSTPCSRLASSSEVEES